MMSSLHLKNRLLASLPPEDFVLLSAQLSPVDMEKGRLLYEPSDPIETVYFPHDCVISLLTLMRNGAAIESVTIGREGAFGLLTALSPRAALSRAVIQIAGSASRISASAFQQCARRSPAILSLVDRHSEALFGHAVHSVACNALHSVEARFSRWLLTCRDRIDGDTVSLTQEFLADMLGVQRTTVTAVAGSLQVKGLIRYRRGVVDILDRAGLEAVSCECYASVRGVYERLLPDSFA